MLSRALLLAQAKSIYYMRNLTLKIAPSTDERVRNHSVVK